jgi:hypothetical protein
VPHRRKGLSGGLEPFSTFLRFHELSSLPHFRELRCKLRHCVNGSRGTVFCRTLRRFDCMPKRDKTRMARLSLPEDPCKLLVRGGKATRVAAFHRLQRCLKVCAFRTFEPGTKLLVYGVYDLPQGEFVTGLFVLPDFRQTACA